MAGSLAEERIRTKAEARLRAFRPAARIVHELVLDQRGVRIDLAAISPDELIAIEIKSERDVLKRLPAQVDVATRVAQHVWICIAPRHAPAVLRASEGHVCGERRDITRKGVVVGWTDQYPNPDHIQRLRLCQVLVETDDGFTPLEQFYSHGLRQAEAPAQLAMLWADELKTLCGWARLGVGPRATRPDMIEMALEHMPGKAVRRATLALLRRRSFPRADAPDASAAPAWADMGHIL